MREIDSHFAWYPGIGKGPLPPIERILRVRGPRTQYPSGMPNESFEDVLRAELARQGLVPADAAVQPGEQPDQLAERLSLPPGVAAQLAIIHAEVTKAFALDPAAAAARYKAAQKPAPPPTDGTLDVTA